MDSITLIVIAIISLSIILPISVIINRSRSGRGEQMKKQIMETKCTCQACGKTWYYGKKELQQNKGKEIENFGKDMSNCGSDMMCCGGCFPAAFIPKEQKNQIKDLNKCPDCNSSAVKKEEVIHEI